MNQNTLRHLVLSIAITCTANAIVAQNIGINSTGAAPATSAMLDVDATNKGLLVPRVNLVSAISTAPIGASIVNSLLVFNQVTAGAGVNVVNPGYYYWDAVAIRWRRLANDAESWRVLGNSGTDPNTNFLGTLDANALRFRTTNFERFEITTGTGTATGTGGRLQAFQNGTAASPVYSWSTSTGLGFFRQADNVLGLSTAGLERVRFPASYQMQAMGDGTATAPFYTWSANQGMGLYRGGANILGVSTSGIERMRILAAGQVGINGTPAASAQLDVQATDRGVLIPRVALISTGTFAPLVGGVQNSMLVFNTATANTGVNQVTPGFYYWSTAIGRWRRMVDMITDVWLTNPINIAPFQTIILTVTIPGVTMFTGTTVALGGDWAVSPEVQIEHIESRTGAVRFRVTNNSFTTTYNGMDFLITTIRY